MRYECNDENCKAGAEYCLNRSFQELQWRGRNKNLTRDAEKKDSNLWGVGIEVFRTKNRGFGVRAMRSFQPYQAICEYTGEIITQDEADRRMNEDYKGKTVSIRLL
jgi:[histone H3]-lysine4 N-trimethyltransferase ASH1L